MFEVYHIILAPCLTPPSQDPTLQVTATLALSKFMCVSSDFCESHLQLLFTILEKSKNPAIRSNLVIALGDMAVCFSTLIDENISFLYNRLADDDTLVKKNALMVLTHLILNGMVKIKGQIAEMAKCLEDPEPRISDLAKLFFSELASKDNAIYNNLPDIISNLSNPETRIPEEPFRKIMKFLFSFDFAEKVCDSLNVKSPTMAMFDLTIVFSRKNKRKMSWTNYAYATKTVTMKDSGGILHIAYRYCHSSLKRAIANFWNICHYIRISSMRKECTSYSPKLLQRYS